MPPVDAREDLVRTLLDPEAYPWGPSAVELIETHISWVFLAGDRVVKIKRPVHFGFVDHSDVEQRHHSCDEEARLNQRLTTSVYLGTIPISRAGDKLIVGPGGDPFDWATHMRRLPTDRMLPALIASGSTPANLIDLLADRLIPFHREAASLCDDQTVGSPSALTDVVTTNLDELREFSGRQIGGVQFSLVEQAMRAFIIENSALFQTRVTNGWVRDGHGDLRAEHICLEEHAVQIFDCVEFSQSLRCADIGSDLAFLLMDLRRLGAESLAAELEEQYRASGIDLPVALMRFYRTHRALVRAKIDCLTMAGGLSSHSELAAEATVYLDLATRSALTIRPFLIAMTGLSGTGKSTVAGAIARATGAEHISSDSVRKEMAGVNGSAAASWGEGLYNEEWNDRTYEHLILQAAKALQAGRPVILDATFLDDQWRERASRVAKTASVPFLLVETVCDVEVAESRIAARTARGGSPSDADLAIFRHQRVLFAADAVVVPREAIAVSVDTTSESGDRMDPAFAALREANVLVPSIPIGAKG